jgi:ABC-type amino acid transport substrate-binding protein
MTRALPLALALALCGAAAAAQPAFRMGVRVDARPFVFADGSGYRGFLYDMCRAAAAEAGFEDAEVELVPVTAATRFEAAPELDLLCDPTTVTMERAATWSFTPIVFFASSVALRRTPPVPLPAAEAPTGCDAGTAREMLLAGWIEGTTSARAAATLDARTARLERGQVLCLKPYPTHDDAVRDICSRDGTLSLYVGDADILSAQVEAMRREGLPCPAGFEPGPLQPEPYALIVGSGRPELQRQLTLGIYRFFRSGAADRSFAANFGDRRKSATLQTLFDHYRIPEN